MKTFRDRRVANTSYLIAASVCLLFVYFLAESMLVNTVVFTGEVLLGLCLVLTFFNVRKKLTFIPMLKASTWTQIHIYLGFFTLLLFLVHLRFQLPTGRFEIILTIIFTIVGLSGVVGLLLTRILPAKMTDSGENLTFVKIPSYREKAINEVEELIITIEKNFKESHISDFYVNYGEPFMSYRPKFLSGIFRSKHLYGVAKFHLDQIVPLIEKKENASLVKDLQEWLDAKRNIDYQECAQKYLKGWLFIHIPFTYSLLLFIAAHVYLVMKFMDGV